MSSERTSMSAPTAVRSSGHDTTRQAQEAEARSPSPDRRGLPSRLALFSQLSDHAQLDYSTDSEASSLVLRNSHLDRSSGSLQAQARETKATSVLVKAGQQVASSPYKHGSEHHSFSAFSWKTEKLSVIFETKICQNSHGLGFNSYVDTVRFHGSNDDSRFRMQFFKTI